MVSFPMSGMYDLVGTQVARREHCNEKLTRSASMVVIGWSLRGGGYGSERTVVEGLGVRLLGGGVLVEVKFYRLAIAEIDLLPASPSRSYEGLLAPLYLSVGTV
jgi:hypothetical protein